MAGQKLTASGDAASGQSREGGWGVGVFMRIDSKGKRGRAWSGRELAGGDGKHKVWQRRPTEAIQKQGRAAVDVGQRKVGEGRGKGKEKARRRRRSETGVR